MKPMLVPMFAALLLAAPAPALAKPTRLYTGALADKARPPADIARDVARKPAELLEFMGVRKDGKVADFIMGGGYWTRLLSNVVGPTGTVYAYQPAEFISYRAAYASDQDTAVQGRINVIPSRRSLAKVSFPEPLDAILTVQNWHDLHLKQSPAGFAASVAKVLYASLKPGGVMVVVDHVGPPSDTPFASADSLHRGDAAATRAEFEAAGFKLEAQSPLYADPADTHTTSVFDPAIRGKTDQFIYKFRKPK